MRLKYRRQPPVRGGRRPLPSCVIKEIDLAVRDLAIEYGVSRSWVISVLLAHGLGIKKQPDFIVKGRRG